MARSATKQQYIKLAKRADQRLVRLEQAGLTNTKAYQQAQAKIGQLLGEGRPRFNRNIPKTAKEQKKVIKAIEQFLEAPTSTKKGVKRQAKVEKKKEQFKKATKQAQKLTRYEQLEQEYHALAKRADTRLRNLEKLSRRDGYADILYYAYARAMRDIQAYSGEGARRFDTKAPADYMKLLAKINDIKTFIESTTSTKKKIDTMHRGKADTLNEKYGLNLSLSQYESIFTRGIFEKLSNLYGSSTAWRMLREVKKADREVLSAIARNKNADVRITDDLVLDSYIKDALKNQGFNIGNLYY